MVLIIDNYDSFTYNLVQFLGELGAKLQVFRNDRITSQQITELKPERIVISPGPGVPSDAGISKEIIRLFHRTIPILGVCLGHQAIGEVFGGRIVPAPKLMHGKVSRIKHDGRTIFEGLPQDLIATRYHSLMVSDIPACLDTTATTDGTVVMGLRHREFPTEGIQFHPESIMTSLGKDLLFNFLKLKWSKTT